MRLLLVTTLEPNHELQLKRREPSQRRGPLSTIVSRDNVSWPPADAVSTESYILLPTGFHAV